MEVKAVPQDITINENTDIGATSGPATRFDANLEAVRAVKRIETEGREYATPEEQGVISRFSGWGDSAFNDAFDVRARRDKGNGMTQRGEQLQALVTKDEYDAISNSRRTAYFTSPGIVRAMWDAMTQLGANRLSRPRILEPSAGSGRFFAYQPQELAARSQRIAVELDSLTGKMLKYAFPQTQVYGGIGYQNATIPRESVDIAISNIPFSRIGVLDTSFTKGRRFLTKSLHNYFFAKTLDNLRPGGVLGFITTHQTLDAPTAKGVREALSEQADLLGAIRLPKNAFPDTEVCTDIVFMRKRLPNEPKGDTSWVDTGDLDVEFKYRSNYGEQRTGSRTFQVNQYFIDHPEMVMGVHSTAGSMHEENEYTVERVSDVPLLDDLMRVIKTLPKDVIEDKPNTGERFFPASSPANIHEGSWVVSSDDGELYVKAKGQIVKSPLDSYKNFQVRQLLGLRDAAKKVLDIQVSRGEDKDLEGAQKELNGKYDEFVQKYGALNNELNFQLMKYDPDGAFLRALEIATDKKGNTLEQIAQYKGIYKKAKLTKDEAKVIKMPFFRERVLHGMEKKATADSELDAMSIALNETGRLDFVRMGELLGQTPEDVQRSLSEQGIIFKNPLKDWETADEYLCGDVKAKLKEAEVAVIADASYKRNITALKAVQPVDIEPSQIGAKLGSTWIPAEYMDEFIRSILYSENRVRSMSLAQKKQLNFFRWEHDKEWAKVNGIFGESAKMRSEWGTESMPADKIIEHILDDKPCDVKVTLEVDGKVQYDKDGKAVKVKDARKSAEAEAKAAKIKEAFNKWLWDDTERAKALSKIYNESYNTHVNKRFDGSHLVLPGIVDKWSKWMEKHQKDAIWRIVKDRTALLAHEVGFGKTACMVAGAMELRRLGLSKKNLIVVPKATHEQMRDDFLDIYPYAKILFPAEDDFTKAKRPEFEARAITGDWDAIILTYEQFAKIGTKPETQVQFIKEEIEEYRNALEENRLADDEDSKANKALQDSLAALELKLETLQAELNEKVEQTVKFEDLGVDQLFVDEADNFKNLKFTTKEYRLKGLPQNGSVRAWDMYCKVRHLQRRGGAGIVFATGTPVSNTIAEQFTMMRYLQPDLMEAKHIQNFDAWKANYGVTTNDVEQTVTGKYTPTRRFTQFMNLPELSHLWQQTADIRVADEVPAIVRKRPKLVDDKGEPKRTVISVPASEALISYVAELQERAKNLTADNRKEDNMLKISNDARKASLDIHMVKKDAPEEPNGKIPTAAKQIAKIYNQTMDDKGVQLVFLDLGTPKAGEEKPKKEAEKVAGATEEESPTETAEETQLINDEYRILKENLLSLGIPEDKIAFIHSATNRDKKTELLKKANAGEIRVLVGSTGKLGTGINVQSRACALHHLDAPWKPRDIEQREGRVIRQGNKVYGPKFDDKGNVIDPGKGVRVYTYVTERSFDAFMWQAIAVKSKAIKAVMRRDNPPRTSDDIDAFTMSAAECMAIASGNPDQLKLVHLKHEIANLQLLQASYLDEQITAKRQLQFLPPQITGIRGDIAKLDKDLDLAGAGGDKFSMKVNGMMFTERPKASENLFNAIKHATDNQVIGEYKGFQVKVHDGGPSAGYTLKLVNPDTGYEHNSNAVLYSELTPEGAMSRLGNTLSRIKTVASKAKNDLMSAEDNLATYQRKAGKPWEKQAELTQLETEYATIQARLEGKAPAEQTNPMPDANGQVQNQVVEAVKNEEITHISAVEREPYQMSKEEFAKSFLSPLHGEEAIESVTNPDYVKQKIENTKYLGLPEAALASVQGTIRKAAEETKKKNEEELYNRRKFFVLQALKEGKAVSRSIVAEFEGIEKEAKDATRIAETKPEFTVSEVKTIINEIPKIETPRVEAKKPEFGQSVITPKPELVITGHVQTGLAGIGTQEAQVGMLGEFGGAPGTGGEKQTLIDVEKEKAKAEAKPLPGQIEAFVGPPRDDMMRSAIDWQYLTVKAGGMATKSKLDDWLKERFGIDAMQAREISNSIEIEDKHHFSIYSGDVHWQEQNAHRPEPKFEDYPDISKRQTILSVKQPEPAEELPKAEIKPESVKAKPVKAEKPVKVVKPKEKDELSQEIADLLDEVRSLQRKPSGKTVKAKSENKKSKTVEKRLTVK